ncbi:MAG: DNA-binding response regulator [Gammaproteobacteria bacterium]|nr:MAG: DNA-binding response regulator [Gammaproteobacteria bacterium]
MKILIVDDEPLARQRLIHLLREQPGCEVIGEAVNGFDALEKTQQLSPDLILMDIRMPGMDGLEAARHLDILDEPPRIIFTTAYNEHALEAFDVHAIGYLVKPVRAEKLEKAIASINRPVLSRQAQAEDNQVTSTARRNYISARVRGNIVLVAIGDIYYFHAEHKYVDVRHKGGELLIEEPLKNLEEEFPDTFLRIHRNALVAKKFISGLAKNKLGHWHVTFRDIDVSLEVSRRHTTHVRKIIKNL